MCCMVTTLNPLCVSEICLKQYTVLITRTTCFYFYELINWYMVIILQHKLVYCAPLHSHNVICRFRSVQFSGSAVSNFSWPHGPQHTRIPCQSPTPGVYSHSSPFSRWRHPTISSSVIPFSSCLQSFPASGSFQMSQLFTSGGQRIGVSASTSVLSMNTQDWSPLGWTAWISLQSKRLSRVFSNNTFQKHQFCGAHLSL